MSQCGEHKQLAEDIANIKNIVTRIDHGLNGVNGSIGLVERVKNIESTIKQNSPLWSKMRGLTSNLSIIIRTLIVGILMAVGGYLWAIILGASR